MPAYAVARIYEMSEDWDDILHAHLTDRFTPAPERLPGFVSYQAIEADLRLSCSVTVFEDRTGAEASNRLAAEYVQRNLAARFPTSPEVTPGEITASSGARVTFPT
jgi:hypothetical protein